jgi:7-cyano-7-deazaguanine synthase
MNNLVIGLLAERTTIFPDQSDRFLRAAETALTESIGIKMEIHSHLRDFTKQDVLNLAKKRGISDYYSCHSGAAKPCGKCIACLEYK